MLHGGKQPQNGGLTGIIKLSVEAQKRQFLGRLGDPFGLFVSAEHNPARSHS
jgi:hypothetical protein